MIPALKQNVVAAQGILREMNTFIDSAPQYDAIQQRLAQEMLQSLKNRLAVINASLPQLIRLVKLSRELREASLRVSAETASQETSSTHAPMEEVPVGEDVDPAKRVTLPRTMRSAFMQELQLGEKLVKRLSKKRKWRRKKEPAYKKPSLYGKIANTFFLSHSQNLVRRGKYKSLGLDIRKSNMDVLTVTYLSMMFFTMFISFFVGVAIALFFLFFSIDFLAPGITFYQGELFTRIMQVFWIAPVMPFIVWVLFYLYPGAEMSGNAKRIENELPFVVVHMGSIAGSGIEPLEIFRIIAMSQDYKYAGKEMKKIINQTTIYGYDLSTALRNVARSTPSERLSELLNGMSITINSGGDIQVFFEKRAESLLLEYRIAREKFTKNAETVMDIYISVVISTPMILLLLLVMISVSGLSVGGLSIDQMSFGIIAIVVAINVIFLAFLQMKQPSY